MKPDASYHRALFSLALPMMVQFLFTNGLALVDAMLVGQLGDTAVAAVGLAGQVLFLLNLLYFGLSSGSGIFIAQFWGRQDVDSIRRVFGLNLIANALLGVAFTILAQVAPVQILGLLTRDMQVIAQGSAYLRVASWGYTFFGISAAIYMMLRSTENVKVPMLGGAIALSFNTLLGYCLIFGRLGLPELGTRGAAVAFVFSRALEVGIAAAIISLRAPYNHIRPIFAPGAEILRRYTATTLPVAINELAWALGITTYTAIYAHIGTESVTATSITASVENLVFVPFLALGNATAILVGKKIGAGDPEMAYAYGQRSLTINIFVALTVSALLMIFKGPILDVYRISDAARANAHALLTAMAFALLFKTSNFGFIVGVLRAGGDTRFAMFMEFCTMWLWGVPAAFIAANLLHLPVYYVILFVYSEEIIKFTLTLRRFRSRRWVHHLAIPAASESA